MKYSPFDNRVLPIFGFYFVLIIFGIIFTFKLIKKYKERKQDALLHLAAVYAVLTAAIAVLAIGLTEAVLTGYYKEIYRFSLPLAYSLVVLANIFLFYFVSNITDRWKNAFLPLILIGLILIIIIFLPWNWWGYPKEEYQGKLNTRLYTNVFFISYSYAIYISIIVISYQTRKIAEDKISHVGLSLLLYSMFFMMMFYVMILFDNILIVLYNHPGYSEFQFAAWFFALVFVILSYMSLVMPEWLKKRIKD